MAELKHRTSKPSQQLAEEDVEPLNGTSTSGDAKVEDGAEALTALKQNDRYRSFRVRTVSTLAMIGSFIGVIYLGHVPLMALIFWIQQMMCKELFKLARAAQPVERPVSGTKFLQWYFFGVAAFWMYFRFIERNLLVEITSDARLLRIFGWMLTRHPVVSYALYTAGFIRFVLSLQKGHYLHQFGQFAWIHMILLVIFIPSSFFVSNIFDGLIWFLLPCALVIINDIGAYLAGFFLGRTPLIKLSPKKTWEGFVGGAILTLLASWYLSSFMSKFKWMTCPRTDLSMGWLNCEPDDIYQDTVLTSADVAAHLPAGLLQLGSQVLPQALQAAVSHAVISVKPIQFHALVLSLFASVIAPFGGFFASGFKRGFKIKDFGDSIPGHGGMTDRMDCQVVMAVFAYLYYNNYVDKQAATVGFVLSKVLLLSATQQLELFTKLANMLVGEDYLPDRFTSDFAALLRKYQIPVTVNGT